MKMGLDMANRLFMPFCFVMFFVACITLFYSAERVQALRSELDSVNKDIAQEQEAYRVMTAEWAYLNTPERLSKMAGQYLSLQPRSARQTVTLASVPMVFDEFHETDDIQEEVMAPVSSYFSEKQHVNKATLVKDQPSSLIGVSLQNIWSEAQGHR